MQHITAESYSVQQAPTRLNPNAVKIAQSSTDNETHTLHSYCEQKGLHTYFHAFSRINKSNAAQ
jgi:hypothetical protein